MLGVNIKKTMIGLFIAIFLAQPIALADYLILKTSDVMYDDSLMYLNDLEKRRLQVAIDKMEKFTIDGHYERKAKMRLQIEAEITAIRKHEGIK